MSANPLLNDTELPAFGQILPEHVEPALTQMLEENRARITRLEALPAPTFATLIVPLEEMRHRLSRLWSPVGHLNAVMNTEALRQAYNACLPLLSAYSTDLSQSEALYHGFSHIAKTEAATLDADQRELLEHGLRDFRLAGVALDAEHKAQFKALMMELSQLSARFEENVLDATNAWSHHVT